MTNIRKLMGRLNPATCRFDIGRGGIPELTPQDIAGALGMVRDEFAREVFCAVWWPDGARLERNRLLQLIALKQRAEIDKQWRRVQAARLDLHIASDDLAARNAATDHDRRVIAALKARLEEAKRLCWPNVPEMYPVIRAAVLDELASPKLCVVCAGRGAIASGDLVVECKQCDGTGKSAISSRQRAARIGRDESTYRKEWAAAYEWTYALVSDAEHEAAKRVADIAA